MVYLYYVYSYNYICYILFFWLSNYISVIEGKKERKKEEAASNLEKTIAQIKPRVKGLLG